MLLHSNSIMDMITQSNFIFKSLCKFRLNVKPEKCQFFKETFLGHTISTAGIHTDKTKIQAVKDFARLSTEKAVRQFMGLSSYFRCFIKGYAQIAGPISDLLPT